MAAWSKLQAIKPPLLVNGILNGLDVAAGTTKAEVVTDVPTTLKWLPGVSYRLSKPPSSSGRMTPLASSNGHGETHHTTAFLVAARNSPWGGPLLVDGILNGLDVAAETTEAEVVTDVPTTLKWLPGVSYRLSKPPSSSGRITPLTSSNGHGETHHTTAFLVAARNSPWGGRLLVDGILYGLDVAAGTTEAKVVTDVPRTLKWLPGVSSRLAKPPLSSLRMT